MARSQRAQSSPLGRVIDSLENQLTDHVDESRMSADRRGSHHVDAQLVAQLLGFGVEIEGDFQVIGNETDGHNDDVSNLLCCKLPQIVVDVRL